jgi:hypothetical protein
MTAQVATQVAKNFRVCGKPVIFYSEHLRKGCYCEAASPGSCLSAHVYVHFSSASGGTSGRKIIERYIKYYFTTQRTSNIEVFHMGRSGSMRTPYFTRHTSQL